MKDLKDLGRKKKGDYGEGPSIYRKINGGCPITVPPCATLEPVGFADGDVACCDTSCAVIARAAKKKPLKARTARGF